MIHPKRLHIVRPVSGQLQKRVRGPLLFLCTIFFVGAMLGSIFAMLGGGHPQLSEKLTTFIHQIAQGDIPEVSLLQVVWDALCWPILMILLSYGPLGVVGIPGAFLLRGFLLSYACTTFVAMYGLAGIGWNLLFFGASVLLLLPVTVCMGYWAFSCAYQRHSAQNADVRFVPSVSVLVCCIPLQALFVMVQGLLLPAWLPTLCKQLLSVLS